MAPTITISDLELAAAGGWRAPEESSLGDWVLRAAAGFTGRANSALAIADPGMPTESAIDYVRDWYRVRGLPAMIAVPSPVGPPPGTEVERVLAGLGWRTDRGAVVMTREPWMVSGDDLARVDLAGEPDEGWLSQYRYRGERPAPIARLLLMSAPWQAFGAVRLAGRTVAIGRVAVASDWAGLTAIAVDPRHRRRGFGRAVTIGLAAAAASHGVVGLYLQVESENTAARALYGQIGFTDHHIYRYWTAPA